MKKKRKLAQAAMEFLLSYGWAILVVIVVIGALTYFNVLDPSTLLPDKCVLQAGPLRCVDNNIYFLTAYNKVQFHMKLNNQMGNAVQIKSIKISREGFGCEHIYSDPYTISGGSEANLAFSCPDTFSKQKKKEGFDMQITYFLTEGFEKTISGNLFSTLNDLTPENYHSAESYPQQPGDGNGDGVIDNTDYDIIRNMLSGIPDERSLDNFAYDFDCTGDPSGGDLDVMIMLLSNHYGETQEEYQKAAKEHREQACISNGLDPNWRP